MRACLTTSLLLLSLIFISGTRYTKINPSGDTISQKRSVAKFDKISASSGIRIIFTQSSDRTVEVSTQENLMPHITTEVVEGEFRCYVANKIQIVGRRTIEITISNPSLNEVSLSGGSRMELTKAMSINKLDVELSGGSVFNSPQILNLGELDIDMSGGSRFDATQTISADKLIIGMSGGSRFSGNVVAKDLSVEGSGGSTCKLSGESTKLIAEGSGGTRIGTAEFKCKILSASLSGGSAVTANVSDEISLVASGGSSLRYIGQPKFNKIELTGGSSCKTLQTK